MPFNLSFSIAIISIVVLVIIISKQSGINSEHSFQGKGLRAEHLDATDFSGGVWDVGFFVGGSGGEGVGAGAPTFAAGGMFGEEEGVVFWEGVGGEVGG